jgi:hypothetical protein
LRQTVTSGYSKSWSEDCGSWKRMSASSDWHTYGSRRIASRQRWMVSRGRRDMRGAVPAILGNGDSSDADADAAKPRGEGPCANALQRPGASLWQDAGAPAGWADGQVGTSHFVQAPSMRPIHATATSRAIHVPASMTKRGMIPLAQHRPRAAGASHQSLHHRRARRPIGQVTTLRGSQRRFSKVPPACNTVSLAPKVARGSSAAGCGCAGRFSSDQAAVLDRDVDL